MAEYYVNKSGNDGNSGADHANAWASIQHAIDTISSDDTIWVGSGVYEENLTYRIPIHTNINGYMGIILGYCFSNEKTNEYISNKFKNSEKKKNTFVTFITFEIEYELPEHRSIFLQCKSGITDISKEIHILLGFNFEPRKKY